MRYELEAWKNVDLHEDGDFCVTAIEPLDSDGEYEPFERARLYGFWTPLNGTEVPATAGIELDEPAITPDDIFSRGWYVLEIAAETSTFRVVRRSLSDTAAQLAYSDAPFVLEKLTEDGWQAIWGLDEMCSTIEALQQVPREILADLL
jgi:hypothetical protein